MYLTNSISWKSIGFLFFVLILLQACSGADDNSNPTPSPIPDPVAKSCETDLPFFNTFVTANYGAAKVSDGGKLYDNWATTLGKSTPSNDHPLWKNRATDSDGILINTRSGSDTWRCKECHAWDYKGPDGAYNTSSTHYTGFPGITLAKDQPVIDVFCKIRDGVGVNTMHMFNANNTGGALTDFDILALTKFVREGQVEVNDYINATTKIGTGDQSAGATVYTQATPTSCSNSLCHGIDGTVNLDTSLKMLSLDNPWEVLHKIRFGHPGASPEMPAFSETISETDIKNVLSYVQTLEPSCITDNTTLVNDHLASTSNAPWDGGQVYDQWWDGTVIAAPTSTHPLWSSQTNNLNTAGAGTWRCKECHGWDYKGKDGAYGPSSSHYTGFNGIVDAANKTPVDVYCAIAQGTNLNKQHNFLKTTQSPDGLTQIQILQLTSFITASNDNGLVDANDYITTSGQGRGDVTNGKDIYLNNPQACQTCHGIDGLLSFEAGVTLGALATENPWEVLHKIRYGHPNSIMPSFTQDAADFELTVQEIKDVLTYAQTLTGGTTPIPPCSTDRAAFVDAGFAAANAADGGRLYDNWMRRLGVSAPATDHPLWINRAIINGTYANTRSGTDSWRCKECHGWDYNGDAGVYNSTSSHYTGFTGLLGAVSKTPIAVFCAIRDGEGIDPAHGFTPAITGNKLNDDHILQLTKFILDGNQMGMINTTAYISSTGIVTGNLADGETVYTTSAGCANSACHGINGDTNAGGLSIGQIAFENPWEVLHKIRNGHAALNSPMPSFVNSLDSTQIQNVLAYAQNSLPRSTGGSTACRDEMTTRGIDSLLANVTPWDGGQLYDKWWGVNETPPSTDHTLWALQTFNTNTTGSGTWRCKECHGWDYKGDAGAYDPNSTHYTGFTGILASASKSAADIFCALRDGEGINADHKFNIDNTNGLMTETRLLQLTRFITAGGDAGMLDSAIFVDAAGKALGDPIAGNDIYFIKAACSDCHGATGLTNVPVGVTLGDIANQNPWEMIHKIRFGNPGQDMPIYTNVGLLNKLNNNEIKNVLAFAQTLPETTVAGNPTTPATCATDRLDFVTTNIDAQSASQGGALYDKWWVALGYAANAGPTQDNPLWVNADATNTSTGSDTWRCKECHGWDYQGKDGGYGVASAHYTGFPGIVAARSKSAIEVFCAISQGTTAFTEHKFNPQNTQMTDQAILQLTKFITDPTNGALDMNTYIDPVSKTPINADATVGKQEFNRCTVCHGAEGLLNAGGSTLGAVAIANPWEVLHKIRNGNPGSNPVMPAFINSDLTLTGMLNIIAHLQTLPTTGGQNPPPVTNADDVIVRGGLLYDDWMSTTGVAAPAADNPLWAYQNTNNRTGADTWRCKECHGWDYKGRDGQYGPGSSHFTGYVGVWGIANKASVSEQAIFDSIKFGTLDILGATIHDFGPLLTDPDIMALAKFIKQGLVDPDLYISSSTGIANGNVTNGELQYVDTGDIATINNANCSFCHGLDGTEINFGTVTAPESLGTLSRMNPWEVLHKARFGQPATVMPSAVLKGLSIGTVIDVITYTQTLPDATPPIVVGPPIDDD